MLTEYMNFDDPNELLRQIEQAKRTQELIDRAGGLDNLRKNIEYSRKMVDERNLNNLHRNQNTIALVNQAASSQEQKKDLDDSSQSLTESSLNVLLLQPEQEESREVFDLVSRAVNLEYPAAVIETINDLQHIYKSSAQTVTDAISKANLIIGNMDGGNVSVTFGLDIALSQNKPILLIVRAGKALSVPTELMNLKLLLFAFDRSDQFINDFRHEVRNSLRHAVIAESEQNKTLSENNSQPVDDVLESYKYENLIGEGYFSTVSRYIDTRNGRKVAVKHLKKGFKDNEGYKHRFEREINLLTILAGHPNIIEFLGEGVKEERPFYIMPASNTNLENLISAKNQTLTTEDRVDIFDQVLEAITFAHSHTILHRDISPNNALIFEESGKFIIKVSDFGLGKNWADDSGYTFSVTANYGQPIYAAPEQLGKLKDASESSDIFALGRLLDFTLTGKKPLVINTKGAFRRVIEKATQPEPESRYKNIGEFKEGYERAKRIVLPSEDADLESPTNFRNDDGVIDWLKFDDFANKGEYIDSVYGEYISVVVEILLDATNSRNYVATSPDSGRGFVETFCQRIRELPGTGWPFKDVDNFAVVFKNMFFLTKDHQAKLLALGMIWQYAYEWDQWSAQGIIQRIINENYVPESLHEEFAMEILESSASRIDVSDFNSPNIPKVIKRAIIEKAKV